jgi:hypothetical protein
MATQHYDNRPALQRFLWRDRTQEHWAYSLAVDMSATIVFQATVIGALYLTRHWWAPFVVGVVCQ